MSIDLIANLSYIVAAILFIFGLKMLGHPNTARRGNGFSALGMFIAVVAGLTENAEVSTRYLNCWSDRRSICAADARRIECDCLDMSLYPTYSGAMGSAISRQVSSSKRPARELNKISKLA